MNKIITFLKASVLMAATFVLVGIGVAAFRISFTLEGIANNVHQVTTAIVILAKHTNDILVNVRMAADSLQGMGVQEQVYYRKIDESLNEINNTIADMRRLVDDSDDGIKRISESSVKTLDDTDKNLNVLTTQLDKQLEMMSPGINNLNEASANASKILGDPSIQVSLANTATATRNIADTTKHVEQSTAELEAYTRRLTTPASWAKRVALTIADLSVRFWGAFVGAK